MEVDSVGLKLDALINASDLIKDRYNRTFPMDIYPSELVDIALHYQEIKGYNVDYVGCSILSAISTAMGSTHRLRTVNSYNVFANLYIALIGNKGVNKSSPLEDFNKPTWRQQNHLYEVYQEEMKRYKEDPENNEKPFYGKPILSDVTPEAIAIQLAKYRRGNTIVVDELASLLLALDKYRMGADEQFYLQAWSNKNIVRDRVNGDSLQAIDPCLSIVGTIQPGVADKAFLGKEESGFFDRWLICYPDNVLKPYPGASSIDPIVEAKYDTIIGRLLKLQLPEVPIYLSYTSSSWLLIYEWICKSTDIENNPNTSERERGIRAKLAIYIHRFALILQMARFACDGDEEERLTISENAAVGAVKLADYFFRMAEKTRLKSKSDMLPMKWKELYDLLPDYEMPFKTIEFVERCSFLGISERTAKDWIRDNSNPKDPERLFDKVKHGIYAKR